MKKFFGLFLSFTVIIGFTLSGCDSSDSSWDYSSGSSWSANTAESVTTETETAEVETETAAQSSSKNMNGYVESGDGNFRIRVTNVVQSSNAISYDDDGTSHLIRTDGGADYNAGYGNDLIILYLEFENISDYFQSIYYTDAYCYVDGKNVSVLETNGTIDGHQNLTESEITLYANETVEAYVLLEVEEDWTELGFSYNMSDTIVIYNADVEIDDRAWFGDTVDTDSFDICFSQTVTSTDNVNGKTAMVDDEGTSYSAADGNYLFVTILDFTNTSEEAQYVSYTEFEGYVNGEKIVPMVLGVFDGYMPLQGTVNAGETFSGYVIWELPAGWSDYGLQFRYSDSAEFIYKTNNSPF